MLGAPIGVMLWAVLGFFNGISRPRITVMTTALVGVVNVVLNQVFIFELGWGIAGAAWATNASMLCGVAFALGVFLRPDLRHAYKTHVTWRPDAANLWREFKLGLPMGAMYAADLFGMALFSLMQVRLGQVDGATTQIVVMLTSIAYMPGVGLALAGTTLVGQAIGAGDRDWARRLGNAVIAVTMGYMGAVGVLLAVLGPWLMPFFVGAGDPQATGRRAARRRAAVDRRRLPALRRPAARLGLRAARRGRRARAGASSSSGCPGACSCRSRTCSRSRRARAGSTRCRSSASARWAAGSRCSPTWCCSAARCTCAGDRDAGRRSGSRLAGDATNATPSAPRSRTAVAQLGRARIEVGVAPAAPAIP